MTHLWTLTPHRSPPNFCHSLMPIGRPVRVATLYALNGNSWDKAVVPG